MRETTINFATGRAIILDSSHDLLHRLAMAARRCQAFKIVVSGHTDSVGAADLNQQLSESRARAVTDYLVTQGVPGDQLTARGFGEARPVGDNRTREGRAQNRRIEFTIEK